MAIAVSIGFSLFPSKPALHRTFQICQQVHMDGLYRSARDSPFVHPFLYSFIKSRGLILGLSNTHDPEQHCLSPSALTDHVFPQAHVQDSPRPLASPFA